jgi:ornithine cyclodeaminase/alanine dehydrogenase-like protein (mu-crystallin family)
LRVSDIVVTCTTAQEPIVHQGDLRPGAFLAAVGADNPDKHEIDPMLLASATVVADVLDQSSTMGDVAHAITAGLLTRDDVYGELGEIVCRRKPGRRAAEEIIVFDSTGMALQDVAASALVYQRALERGAGRRIALGA